MWNTLRKAVRVALLPLVQGPEEVLVGGQAVIEGVMMRSPHSWAVAVRKPSGSLAVSRDYLDRPSERRRWLKYPVLRGLGVLGQAMLLGLRALRYSAQEALEDEGKPPGNTAGKDEKGAKRNAKWNDWFLVLNLVFSLGFFIAFYKFLPLYAATLLERHYGVMHNFIVFNLADGIIRLLLFLGFLVAIAQGREIKRVFEYHGAEHKVVWAFEKTGGNVDIASARESTRFHPRCGTSFLLVVMVIALIIYLFLPFQSFLWKFVSRILLLPVIAGVSYEFIRYAAKSRGWVWRMAAQPGLWLQRITTREPDDRQLETAMRALEAAMELERTRGGELVVA
ncbi:MAG: DUF1385 domain-containing protein [Terriglobia bacterium]